MLSKLPPRERQIVDILYQQGPVAVSEICDALPDPLSGSAVRAMLKRLEDKGYVQRTDSERGYLYSPAVADSVGVASPIGDQIGDGRDLEAVELRHLDEIGHARHGAVVVHHLADHARGVESGQAGDVDGSLGVSGAHQHAARPRHQREDMSGRDVIVAPLARVYGNRDRVRAVRRG